MNIVLYQFPGACSRVTLNALEEIGAPYALRTVNMRSSAQQSPEYLAVNPKGKVPAIAFDSKVMTESPAILYALHRQYPNANLLPTSTGLPDEFKGLSDLIWCGSVLHPIVRQVRMPARYTKGDASGVNADGMEKMAKECKAISARFGAQGWWYGAHWSIVDVYLYWVYSTAAKGSFSLDPYPELAAHAARVRQRPSFVRALAAEIKSVKDANIEMTVEQL